MSNNKDTTGTGAQASDKVENDDSFDDVSSIMRTPWDPIHCADWDMQPPSATCLARIKRDICSVFKDPPPGMFIAPDPDNITKIHALVVGPFDTPYEGGFFYFIIRCPPDYPIRPPRCRLMTTGGNTVRFNPNLYRNGKVCLSILGTWSGPKWSPAQCISSLLISIQSLMSENPYHNEPGYENERTPGASKAYNEIIKHETLRAAVCLMLENENSCPKQLREVMIKQYFEFYDHYIDVCTNNLNKDDEQMVDPFGENRGKFEYSSILTRLQKLKIKFQLCETSEQQTDSSTREKINYADPKAKEEMSLDDIFDGNLEDDDEDEEEEDDDNIEQST